ncbi:MAG: molybdenum cofactor guanylyltransferase [Magnetococcus sp. DMHC-8]
MNMPAKMAGAAPTPITGLILAGGLARRLGQVDKALVSLAGRPLLAHVMERLSSQVDRMVISANGNSERFATFGLPVLADLRSSGQGPLAGVEAAFVGTGAAWVLSVAVDLPFLPVDLADRLREPLQRGPGDQAVVAVSAGQCHHVVALWPRSALASVTAALDNGRLALRDWFRHHPHRQAVFPVASHAPDPFFNINRPTDLQVAEALCVKQAATGTAPTDFTST